MHYIRWQGAVAFLIIIGLIAGIAYLLAGPIAKQAIERYGAEYTGAEVNVDSVSVALMPFGLQINQLQATDPKKPENNMVSLTKADAVIELWPLIFGKTIIDSLVVENLTFGDKRQTVGQVYRAPTQDKSEDSSAKSSWLDDMQQNLPDPQSLLDNANLRTVKQAKKLEQTYATEKENLAKIKQNLPDKEKLKSFEHRVKALSKVKVKSLADLEKIKKDFEQLKAEFKQEQAQIKAMKEQVLASKENLATDITALKDAPKQDWQDISTKYQLQTIEAEDFAHLIFGDKARDYYQWAEIALTHIKSSSEQKASSQASQVNDNGRFVHFDEQQPLPEFWLKKAELSLALGQGNYRVNLEDITHQHWLINKQSKLNVVANEAGKLGELNADAQFALNAKQVVTAIGSWSVQNLPLNDIELQNSTAFNLELVKAMLAVVGQFDINNGQLALRSDFALAENEFSGNAESKLANILIDTLSSTDNLSLALSADGDWLSPTWQLDSSLNNLLSDAFKGQVSAKLNEFQSTLTSGLNEKAASSLNLGEGEMSELLQIESLLNSTDAAIDDLANSDVVKQQKKKLENKAKDKLKEKLGKLFG
ncbi:TIGR03545 family protein [Thalassotalea sp. M1531]|uniref:TIGR03545 family protein n=1 Tax=Thalassotalea algicola TaxID=2716224 RepID=A0A7Y0LCU5_9GAMM|nr:TIGR03545 family protein [Thalassotalea algicola]NMP32233.1 TIGR03545 family protein [Thalassotalea algicola]